MEIAGYLGALIMGMLLGLLGGGGSILTVPILVYLFHVDAVLATAYSLFIVGATALIGSVAHLRLGNVEKRAALLFGLPGVGGVILTRRYLMGLIPDPLFTVRHTMITRSAGLLVLLAVLMLLAARNMLKPAVEEGAERGPQAPSDAGLMLRGLFTGMLTSLVGAGGGFLIVPALVAFAKLPMHKAVGTSLVVIAASGLIGAAIDPHMHSAVDARFLALFTGIAVCGSFIGSLLGKRIPNAKLRPAFGWFVLVMGGFIIVRELTAA